MRGFGRDSRNLDLVPQAEFLLYVARDVQLIEQVLRPALAVNDVVLSDRFLYTPEVLGRTGRNLGEDFTAPILRAAAGGLTPDLAVLVDVDPVLARARRKAFKLSVLDKRPPARKGLAGVGLQHRLRRGYLELAEASPRLWAVVDNEDVLEDTVARVTALISEARRDGTPAALERFRAASSARRRAAAAPATPVGRHRRPRRCRRFSGSSTSAWSASPASPRTCSAVSRVPASTNAGGCWPSGFPTPCSPRSPRLTDDVSFELRERLSAVAPAAVARSLAEVPFGNARAAALRAALEPIAPVDVASVVESPGRRGRMAGTRAPVRSLRQRRDGIAGGAAI